MYIALEGIKGVGKTTILTHLKTLLAESMDNYRFDVISPTHPTPNDHPLEVQYAHEPDNDELREQVYAHRSNYHASHTDWQADMIIGDRSIITSLAVRWHRVNNGLSALSHFKQVRAKEHLIAIPDVVIQLDCDADKLLQRYALRERCYGKQEECLEAILALKQHYQSVNHWLKTQEAIDTVSKNIDWITLDTSHDGYLTVLEHVFMIVQMSRQKI